MKSVSHINSEVFDLQIWLKHTSYYQLSLFKNVVKFFEEAQLEEEMMIDEFCNEGDENMEQFNQYTINLTNIDCSLYIYKKFLKKYREFIKNNSSITFYDMKYQISLLEDASLNFLECFDEFIESIHPSYYKSSEGIKMLRLYNFVRKLVKRVVRKMESLDNIHQ